MSKAGEKLVQAAKGARELARLVGLCDHVWEPVPGWIGYRKWERCAKCKAFRLRQEENDGEASRRCDSDQ